MNFLHLRRLVSVVAGLMGLLLVSLPQAALGATARGGLQISLSTSGYRFSIAGDAGGAAAKTKGARSSVPVRESFAATAALANLSKTDVAFTFPDPAAAARLFTFRILDSAGTKIWESGTDTMSAQVITPATLKRGSRWARTVQIPLKVEGTWLAPGQYSLEAAIAGQPAPSASTLFEIAWPAETGGTGIKGRVFQAAEVTLNPFPVIGTQQSISLAIPVKAVVTVEEYNEPGRQYFRAPYVWTVETDEEGNYQLTTPPGRYSVSARKFAEGNDGKSSPSYPVEVTPGRFAVQYIYFPGAPLSRAQLVTAVYSVTATNLGPVGTSSGVSLLHLGAQGTVSSGGWSQPQLRPRLSLDSTVLAFDFVAEPPTGAATQAFMPIAASLDVVCPAGVTKIRVHSQVGYAETDRPAEE